MKVEHFVNKFPNLDRLNLSRAFLQQIQPFIGQSIKLKEIIIYDFITPILLHIHNLVINLITMNKKRQELPKARKITMYVPESLYFTTKWAKNNTDYNLIELKHIDSRQIEY